MSLTFYGYPKCSTCRNAQKWLTQHGQPHVAIDIVQNPPSKEQLQAVLEQSGLDIQRLFNTSGEVYRELKLKERLPGMSVDDKLELLASNGKLIKRPIVTNGITATVGFREEEFAKIWSNG